MTNYVGQQLDEYHLLRLIGTGTFGEVYLGEHVHRHHQVAVKVLRMHLAPDTSQTYFIREVRSMFRLKHPHIVQLLDFSMEQGVHFLVMDYAPNGTLRQRHPTGTRVELEQVSAYVQQIASALQYAHEMRLIHRDIKPQNMLIGRNGETLLSDFGVAAIAHSDRSLIQQEIAGSVAYIAPEQIQGKPRPASDQYSLAVCVYEWLSGERPFRNGTQWELIQQHLFAPPPLLREKLPQIPAAVDDVLLKALSKEPDARFPNINAFATALDEAVKGIQPTLVLSSPYRVASDVLTEPIGPKVSPLKPRNTKLKLLFAALAALLIASIGLLYLYPGIAGNINKPAVNTKATAAAAARAYLQGTNTNGVMFGFDAAHTRLNPYEQLLDTTNVSQLKQFWSYATNNVIGSSPAIANGIIYIGSADHKLYAFDAACKQECQPLWSYETGGVIDSSPVVANGIIYVGSTDSKLYAFDAACKQECQPLWSYETGDVIDSSPLVANGKVYIGSADKKLYAFDAACKQECQPLWSYETGDMIAASPALAGDLLYIGSADGKLYAFDSTCTVDCKPLWSFAIGDSPFSSTAIGNNLVFVGSYDSGVFYAFDAACRRECQPIWSSVLDDLIITSPAIANDKVYIGTANGKLHVFDATCRRECKLGFYATGDTSLSSPTLANGLIFIGGDKHALYAFDASCVPSCQPLWTSPQETGADAYIEPTANIVSTFMNSSPAVANGVVFVGAKDYKLYAFGIPEV